MVEKKSKKTLSIKALTNMERNPMQLVCMLGEVLAERGVSQSELAYLTGLRQASINDMIHNRKNTINHQHLMIIMFVLKIKDISKLYRVEFVGAEEEKDFEVEAWQAENNGWTEAQDEELMQYREELKQKKEKLEKKKAGA